MKELEHCCSAYMFINASENCKKMITCFYAIAKKLIKPVFVVLFIHKHWTSDQRKKELSLLDKESQGKNIHSKYTYDCKNNLNRIKINTPLPLWHASNSEYMVWIYWYNLLTLDSVLRHFFFRNAKIVRRIL